MSTPYSSFNTAGTQHPGPVHDSNLANKLDPRVDANAVNHQQNQARGGLAHHDPNYVPGQESHLTHQDQYSRQGGLAGISGGAGLHEGAHGPTDIGHGVGTTGVTGTGAGGFANPGVQDQQYGGSHAPLLSSQAAHSSSTVQHPSVVPGQHNTTTTTTTTTPGHSVAADPHHKPTMMEKVKGTVESTIGKVTKNPEKVVEGEQLKTGQAHHPATSVGGTAAGGHGTVGSTTHQPHGATGSTF